MPYSNNLISIYRLLFFHEGEVVWQGMTDEFTTSTNPIVQQVMIETSCHEFKKEKERVCGKLGFSF